MVDLPSSQIITQFVRGRKRKKKRLFNPVYPDDFKRVRLMNNLSIDGTAKMLHVTSRTVANWECGSTRIPYSAYKLLRLKANGEMLHNAWEGWVIRDDTLYSPSGRAFKPYELYFIANYFTMARYWLADCNRKMSLKRVHPQNNVVPLVKKSSAEPSVSLLRHMRNTKF